MTLQRFLIGHAITGGVINAILNGPPVLLVLPEGATWHLWRGFPNLAFDTLGMSFGVAWGTGLVLTTVLRKQVAQGKVTLPTGAPERAKLDLGKWPASALKRAFNLGGLAVLACALPTIALLFLLGVDTWTPTAIVTYKTLYGLTMGAIFSPIVALGVIVEHEVSPAVQPLAQPEA